MNGFNLLVSQTSLLGVVAAASYCRQDSQELVCVAWQCTDQNEVPFGLAGPDRSYRRSVACRFLT